MHYSHILIVNGFGLSLSDAFIGYEIDQLSVDLCNASLESFHVYLYMRTNWNNLVSKLVAYREYRRLDHAIDTQYVQHASFEGVCSIVGGGGGGGAKILWRSGVVIHVGTYAIPF